eukprot:1150964-Pelagomonas_calceolata.AAC.11
MHAQCHLLLTVHGGGMHGAIPFLTAPAKCTHSAISCSTARDKCTHSAIYCLTAHGECAAPSPVVQRMFASTAHGYLHGLIPVALMRPRCQHLNKTW